MLEVYDRERTAALLKKAREITAGLKSEMGEIASQMSRVLDGREEDADGIDALETDPQEQGRPQLTIPATTSQQCPTRKSFWQFWRYGSLGYLGVANLHSVDGSIDAIATAFGTRLTSICTATIPSADAGPTDVGDAHRKVSVRAARRPMFYGAGAVVLRLAEPSNAHGRRASRARP